ncbi:AMP-binding protein [Mycolicibacterium pulveris]|uniref:AMP-binding protein n=1 Tax=Mycolicibacterium pulveris TaxID=36813 RepID=UPI003CF4C8DF
MLGSSIPAVLRERASLQPNDVAFTFVDYDHDGAAVPETLTWAQLNRRAANIAAELSVCGAPGDRAVILAPQGLDYIAAFVASLQAGFIAVPLSVPQPGAHDERVTSVLRDTDPAVVLTTSAAVADVADYAKATASTPTVVAVDALDEKPRKRPRLKADSAQDIAYLQYTSGSTREPAGVMITNRNLSANFEQIYADFFVDFGKVAPPGTTVVSWLPLYHDMGLLLGLCVPILGGLHTVLMSPMSFLQSPARWMQLMASHTNVMSSAPNFAFELAVRRTTDQDLAGYDLGNVLGLLSGSERVHPATLRRFTDRFSKFGFRDTSIRPSYGLAEAVVYVATRRPGDPPEIAYFESEKLSIGHAKRCTNASGTPLVSYGRPESNTVRIVDPETMRECPAGTTGEIWVYGENVAKGYWNKPEETERTFGGTLVTPSPGTPEKPWLRTGDLGFISEGELFIMGRVKDLLIVYGRNHYPEDIEATIQEISGGRCAAIAIAEDGTEELVTIVEVKQKGDSPEEINERFAALKNDITSAISASHGLRVADLVLVGPGSLPITTSGKIRRSTCVEYYRTGQFNRIDVR